MLAFWIIGLAFMGSGLAAILFGIRGLETSLGSALLGSGLILFASGVVISALGLVVRQLGQLRDALAPQPSDAVPAIATATLERPSPLKSNDVDRDAAPDHRTADSKIAPREASRPPTAPLPRPGLFASFRRAAPAAAETPPAPAIVHSGTVNNMRYEVRADGTIVAMLPGRKLEFASIDELRAYLALPHDDEPASPDARTA